MYSCKLLCNSDTIICQYRWLQVYNCMAAKKPDTLMISYHYILMKCRPLRHDGVVTWKHSPHHWPFVRGIHQWIPHTKGQWCGKCFHIMTPCYIGLYTLDVYLKASLKKKKKSVEQIVKLLVIWDSMNSMCYHCRGNSHYIVILSHD